MTDVTMKRRLDDERARRDCIEIDSKELGPVLLKGRFHKKMKKLLVVQIDTIL